MVFAFTLVSCSQEPTGIVVGWTNAKATSVSIPKKMVESVPADSLSQLLQIKLKNDTGRSSIFGEFSSNGVIVFKPLLPFSRGSVYEIYIRNKKIDSFSISPEDNAEPTQLAGIYPGRDTLPENLLKIYFRFSRPMQEGRSAQYIKLIRNNSDTLQDVFLDLEPELWNEDRTVLTLWLDPGRIKRGLQPNLRLGSPLTKNDKYSILVSGEWRDGRGLALQKKYLHAFVAGSRDSLGPDPGRWRISDTLVNQKASIRINFSETLDHFLLMECLSVISDRGKIIKGIFIPSKEDDRCFFIPEIALAKGKYTLKIESRLEDPAGNNINKPFDRDIKNSKQPSTVQFHSTTFTIK